jgi:predicted nucleic acid-binding protein
LAHGAWVEYLANRPLRAPTSDHRTVDESLALEAAEVSLALGLAMADSLVYATARRYGARLATSDADFDGLPGAVVVK